MAKHNVGDRRIVSVSIPEDVAQELDRWTGGGKNKGRSAWIVQAIRNRLDIKGTYQQQSREPNVRSPQSNLDFRIETDTMGEMKVPGDTYYGCQTARSLVNFDIGDDVMPRPLSIERLLIGLLMRVRKSCTGIWTPIFHYGYGKPVQVHKPT